VLAGSQIRFAATVECDQVLRVGDRAGRILPAHLASGGKALLATLPPTDLAGLYADTGVDLPRLRRELSLVRKRGFAINDQLTENGLTAVGAAIPWPDEGPVAALSLALPSVRFDREMPPTWVAALSAAVTAIARDLG
jgi:DNA-binding IclR family transcriptional regulator